jgi:predicted PurR-regulated permease PerM
VSDPGPGPGATVFERVLVLAVLATLIVASLVVLEPFALILMWAVFLAVTFWPLQTWLTERLGGRRRLAAGLVVVLLAVVLVAPLTVAAVASVPSVKAVSALIGDPARWRVPAPPGWLDGVPFIGHDAHVLWASAQHDAGATLEAYKGDLARAASWTLQRVVGIGVTLVKLFLAAIITWPILAGGAKGPEMLRQLASRLGGERAVGLLEQAGRTIRSVSLGVIGTALLAATLQTGGLLVAGVPYAPLLGVVSFVLATMQVGTTPVWVGALLWLASGGEVGWAVFTAVWGLALNAVVGNLLGPWLISRGTGLPLTVIFLGVLGGLLSWGLVGVFVGPTLLGVVWTLLRGWLAPQPDADAR